MYISAQYNAAMPNPKEFEAKFKEKIQKEFPSAEVEVSADGSPSIVVFGVDDEDEKERIKFCIIDIRKEVKLTRREWKPW